MGLSLFYMVLPGLTKSYKVISDLSGSQDNIITLQEFQWFPVSAVFINAIYNY